MTSFVSAILLFLSSMGVPGLDHQMVEPGEIHPCSEVDTVPEPDEVPWSPPTGPDTRKISNGF
jgi:hypothetical protein